MYRLVALAAPQANLFCGPNPKAVCGHILQNLYFTYSDETAVKLVFHCAHMLERILHRASLTYPRLNQFWPSTGGCMPGWNSNWHWCAK